MFELAKFCVQSKLKTPLGGPVQTLEAFEDCLEQYMSLGKSEKVASDLVLGINVMERSSHLVMFIEALEMLIQSAATGCSSIIPTPSKSSILFFNANINVCHDWISRIRLKVVQLASNFEDDSLVIRYSYQVCSSSNCFRTR